MAIIHFIWDGITETKAGDSADYARTATSGYFRAPHYTESWTGRNLVYADAGSATPTGGTLFSWHYVRSDGVYDMDITDVNYTIPSGASYNKIISGLVSGKDDWYGDSRDDFFYASSGGDIYHGGGGIDTVDMFFDRSLFFSSGPFLRRQADGSIKLNTYETVAITLDSVERLRFADLSLAVDLDGHAGQVAKLLGAVFGRDAVKNKQYVGIGLDLLDRGTPLLDVAKLAVEARLGTHYSSADLVKLLYHNVVNTEPTAPTLQVYESMLDGGTSAAQLAWLAADSAANIASIDLTGLAQSGLEYIPVPH